MGYKNKKTQEQFEKQVYEKYNGKHPVTGEPLRWQKYRDYLESTASQEVSA